MNIGRSLLLISAVAVAAQCATPDSLSAPITTHTALRSEKSALMDSIFSDIMLTIPAEVKTRVDSASRVGEAKRSSKGSAAPAAGTARGVVDTLGADSAFRADGLSDDVRRQVERAMREMDAKKKKREIEFKEADQGRGNRNGGRP